MGRYLEGARDAIKRLLGNRAAQCIHLPVTSTTTARRWTQWGRYGEQLRMEVPASRLVMQGGMHFKDSAHPFRRALERGLDGLAQYYAENQPGSLLEWHGLDAQEAGDYRVPAWEVPWIERVQRSPPPGEGGLGAEHGVSFYGPVSDEKLRLEHRRLQGLVDGIRRDGYRPDQYGDIVGYFMFDGAGDYRFFVRGGKHRAAVLAHLGYDSIPVAFKPDWPRFVECGNAANWPLVLDGVISIEAASNVFMKYFSFKEGDERLLRQ